MSFSWARVMLQFTLANLYTYMRASSCIIFYSCGTCLQWKVLGQCCAWWHHNVYVSMLIKWGLIAQQFTTLAQCASFDMPHVLCSCTLIHTHAHSLTQSALFPLSLSLSHTHTHTYTHTQIDESTLTVQSDMPESSKQYLKNLWQVDFLPVAQALLLRIRSHYSDLVPLEHPTPP